MQPLHWCYKMLLYSFLTKKACYTAVFPCDSIFLSRESMCIYVHVCPSLHVWRQQIRQNIECFSLGDRARCFLDFLYFSLLGFSSMNKYYICHYQNQPLQYVYSWYVEDSFSIFLRQSYHQLTWWQTPATLSQWEMWGVWGLGNQKTGTLTT